MLFRAKPAAAPTTISLYTFSITIFEASQYRPRIKEIKKPYLLSLKKDLESSYIYDPFLDHSYGYFSCAKRS